MVLCYPSLMASIFTVFFLLSISFTCGGAQPQQKQCRNISLGSSLYPPTSWTSPSGQFALGFYGQGSGFMVGIWLVGIDNITVVWTANRDDPPVTSNGTTLNLTKSGKLLLTTDELGKKNIISDTMSESASYACMFDSGNFVLYNKNHSVIWETFSYPTDTILGGQILSTGFQLFSSLSETNHSTGRYRLKMQIDGNLVLYPVNTLDIASEAYWASRTDGYRNGIGLKYRLYLSRNGSLEIIQSTSMDSVQNLGSSSESNNTIYRATLDVNGFFRLYSHTFDKTGKLLSSDIEWSALEDKELCTVNGFCGFNSFCTLNDNKPYCVCLPGTDLVDVNNPSLGCERNFSKVGCSSGKDHVESYNITTTENMMWNDIPYTHESMSTKEECGKSCLEDCNCEAAQFNTDLDCRRHKLPLKYVRRDTSMDTVALFKVSIRSWNETVPIPVKPTPVHVFTSKKVIVQILVLILAFTAFSCLGLGVSGLYMFKIRVLRYKRLKESETLDLTKGLTLNLYSYDELRKATNGFKDELGRGSFGTVYKGALYKGKKLVAVKRLEKLVEEGEREFRAEMRAIGRTHHKNLVQLLGYCAEGSKRLLVYEFMSNGSLADVLFKSRRRPDWDERARIALDVARGILYLHEECKTPIIHCDIKSSNILMDDFWTAKISDFGLAKLLMPDQTRTFTIVRGTRGYLAPEWQKNTPISVKADVYSYGIVLLEIICCRRSMEVNVPRPEEIVLSTWVYKCFVARELDKIVGGEEVDKSTFENMVKVGLWCIQDEPFLRPSMKSVVLMLEGITDISSPPCPTNTSV
ncbi:G-type lectin S-receptor-like serine/threonine-protein kinase LECRK2 [Quercus robur]|uniref:G-type lectin S-receptor-like serine/threonine-protein kinase LECRK2 n=1 Tax=Quercus robur TaxID=38942 RepID=UPI0021619969|nr:G-type lectin S-receptor-like serine/threonine-protein kinase LECRK2 [Quercus robur]